MRYTLSERLVWLMMVNSICRTIKQERPDWDISLLKKRAKKRYRQIVEGCDDIGSANRNPLRMNLVGGAMWFAFYEAANGITADKAAENPSLKFSDGMDIALYTKICNASMESLGWMYKRVKLFDLKKQKKFIDGYVYAGGVKSNYNWTTVVEPTQRSDMFTYYFTNCGLCTLAQRLGHQQLLPPMCKTDYVVAKFTDAILHRFETLSAGHQRCYYQYTKRGSEGEKIWQEQHKDETRKEI